MQGRKCQRKIRPTQEYLLLLVEKQKLKVKKKILKYSNTQNCSRIFQCDLRVIWGDGKQLSLAVVVDFLNLTGASKTSSDSSSEQLYPHEQL